MRRPLLNSALAATLTAGLLAGIGATPAIADTVTSFPGLIGNVAYDTAHDRIYAASDYSVEVFTATWVHVGTVDLAGQSAGLLTLGNGALWVSEPYAGTIAKVDTTTLTVLQIVGGTQHDLISFAYAAGRLWYAANGLGGTGRLNPVTGATKVFYPSDASSSPYIAGLAADPSDPNVLFAWDRWSDQPSAYRWDASTSPPTVLGTFTPATYTGWTAGAASPDGSRLWLAHAGVNAGTQEIRTSDMTKVMNYPFPGSGSVEPRSVAVAPDGGHFATATSSGPGEIAIYAQGNDVPVRTFDPGVTCGAIVGPVGFADPTTLLVPQPSHPSVLTAVHNATSAGNDSSVTVTVDPPSPAPTDPVTVSGTLTLPSGASVSNRTLNVWRWDTPIGGPISVVEVGNATTSAGGAYSLGDTSFGAETFNTCYQVTYAGDAGDSASSGSLNVQLERVYTSITVAASPTTVAPTRTVTLTGMFTTWDGKDLGGQALTIYRHLLPSGGRHMAGTTLTAADGSYIFEEPAPTQEGKWAYWTSFEGTVRDDPSHSSYSNTITVAKAPSKLTFQAPGAITYGGTVTLEIGLATNATNRRVKILQQFGKGDTPSLVKTITVPTAGSARLTLAPTRNVTYIAQYAGDAVHKSATISRDIGVRALVLCKLLKDAGTSGSYHLYHQADPVFMYGKVKPDHTGQSVTLTLERARASGGWSLPYSDKIRLGDGSQVLVYIKGGVLNIGAKVRVRYSFVDWDHSAGVSDWQYLRIVS